MMQFLLPLAAALGVYGLLRILLRSQAVRLALDHPNERSLHTRPVPRIGGLAIFPVLTFALLAAGYTLPALLAFALSAVSFLDDRYGLPIGLRFLAHCVAAFLFVQSSLSGLNSLETALAVLALMWMVNLFNFMDGSDGLAGGMAAWGFGAYAMGAWLGNDASLCVAALSVSACALAFLCFNFPPAKVFMGDAGSIPLGFLSAALGLYGWHNSTWPLLFPLLVFSPFIADASFTLLKRALSREKIWRAHKTHYYQRLIQLGWGHRKTALGAYALMAFCVTLGLLFLRADSPQRFALLLLALLLYMVLAILIDRAWLRHQKQHEIP